MNNLEQQIDNLRTLQQSYDQVAGAAEAYNEGKPALATAITAKGVTTQPSDSLATMAENVQQIVHEQKTIDGGEMYAEQLFAKQDNDYLLWNLYDVLVQIQNNGSYAHYTGFILAEYFRGYDSIELQGADGYLTCDGDFYSAGATHIWHDGNNGKTNRWIAYFLGENGNVASYTVPSSGLCPRSIHIGGKVGTINCTVSGRIREVVVTDGNELGGLNFGSTQNWDKYVIIRNVNNHNSGYVINGDANVVFYLDETKNIGSILVNGTCANLYEIVLSQVETISQNIVDATLNSLNRVTISVKYITGAAHIFGLKITSSSLKEINLPELVNATFDCANIQFAALEKVIAPKWESYTGSVSYRMFNGAGLRVLKTNLSSVYFTTDIFPFVDSGCVNLIDFETGAFNNNIGGNYRRVFNNWTPTNALLTDSTFLLTQEDIEAGFTSNRQKLLYNIREHIAAKLTDRTGDTPLSITFSASIKAAIQADQETSDAFTNKNWIIA